MAWPFQNGKKEQPVGHFKTNNLQFTLHNVSQDLLLFKSIKMSLS